MRIVVPLIPKRDHQWLDVEHSRQEYDGQDSVTIVLPERQWTIDATTYRDMLETTIDLWEESESYRDSVCKKGCYGPQSATILRLIRQRNIDERLSELNRVS